MDWYTIVQRYYEKGYYTADQVTVFVAAGKITVEQYQSITGQFFDSLSI